MKTITLSQIQNEAKILQDTQNITYNQSLQIIAQKNGFKSYQAILNQIKNDYIYDENEQIKEFKSNVFENRKHIKSNFIKISKLYKKFEEIKFDDKYDDDEERREEAIEEIEQEASKLSNSIAKMFFGNIKYKDSDNEKYFVEGCAYAAYIEESDEKTMINDINCNKADYFIVLNIDQQSFSFGYNVFEIVEYDIGVDEEGNYIMKKGRMFMDYYELPDIELP